MKRSKHLVKLVALCMCAIMVAALSGCMQQESEAEKQQAQNRQFMSQVNQIMEDLQGKLDGFSDAVSREDVVGMRTQADNAFKSLDALNDLEAPDDLKDIKQDYVDGANSLKDALSAYVDLYTEIDAATEDDPFDWSTYDDRVASIKKSYDEGIEKLQAGDQKASEKK